MGRLLLNYVTDLEPPARGSLGEEEMVCTMHGAGCFRTSQSLHGCVDASHDGWARNTL